MLVRSFEESDRPAVLELWHEVFVSDPPWNEPEAVLARKLLVQRDLLLVGELDGELVATAVAGFDGVRGWVHHVAVRPGKRRRGFGREMMQGAEDRLSAMGCPKLNLQVRSSNTEVVEFYRRLGYRVEDRVSLGKLLASQKD